MAANPNLIPTPIVDKNGVASTRLKKQDARTDNGALKWLNPVAALRNTGERRKLAAATQELLTRDDPRDPYSIRNDELSGSFMKSTDIVFLESALSAAQMVTSKKYRPESFRKNRLELIRLLSLHGDFGVDVTDTINAVAAHRKWIEEQESQDTFDTFTSTMSMVMNKYFQNSVQEDGSVKNVEAHCTAYAHYNNARGYGYASDRAAMAAVDAHPDEVDKVLAFIDVRGSEAFSDEAFAEYKRIQPAIAEGWL